MSDILTTQETVRLCELERIIQKGKDTFVEVGTALAEIRDSRIYRATFKTFEDYCDKRWEFSKRQCDRLISAAKVTKNLGPIGPKPESEAQARPLAKLPAEQQPAAWERAQEIAKEESKPVAARHVEAAVLEVMPKEEPETVVVDESKPAKKLPKFVPDDARRLWTLAKTDLDKILKEDKSRVSVLQDVIKYAQNRIDTNK